MLGQEINDDDEELDKLDRKLTNIQLVLLGIVIGIYLQCVMEVLFR